MAGSPNIGWPKTFLIWWALAWRCLVVLPIAFAVGGGIGWVARNFVELQVTQKIVAASAGTIAMLFVSIFIVRRVMGVAFGDSKLALVPNRDRNASALPAQQTPPPSPPHGESVSD